MLFWLQFYHFLVETSTGAIGIYWPARPRCSRVLKLAHISNLVAMCLVSHIWQIDLKMIQFSEVPNCRCSVWVKNWAPLEIGQARHVKTTYAHFVWFPLNIYDPYPASFLPIVALFSLTRSEFDLGFAAWGSAFRGPRKSSVAERKSRGIQMEIWGSTWDDYTVPGRER